LSNYFNSFCHCEAIECPPVPYFEEGPIGERIWDKKVDKPIYEAIAQYSCPEGHVFEIYQESINISINFGLIEDEQSEVNLTCASYGLWLPAEVPLCKRKYYCEYFWVFS
jgi:hypothetical protein